MNIGSIVRVASKMIVIGRLIDSWLVVARVSRFVMFNLRAKAPSSVVHVAVAVDMVLVQQRVVGLMLEGLWLLKSAVRCQPVHLLHVNGIARLNVLFLAESSGDRLEKWRGRVLEGTVRFSAMDRLGGRELKSISNRVSGRLQ